jgi:Amiloride-sensitive sodium channel
VRNVPLQIDNLMADLGGITGITIGLSVITLVETAVSIVSFALVFIFNRSLL